MNYFLIDHQHLHGDEVKACKRFWQRFTTPKNRPLCLCANARYTNVCRLYPKANTL